MRTNIVLDDELMAEAQQLSGLPTKKAIVEEALQLMIRHYKQMQVRKLRGKLTWKGDLDEMREDRFDAVH